MSLLRIAVVGTLVVAATTAPSPTSAFTADYVSDSFELRFGPSTIFCSGRKLYNGKSAGQSDCEAKCKATESCKYYNYWVNSGWCRLTDTCSSTGTASMKILVYVLKESKIAEYELHREEGRCKDVSIYRGQTDGVEDCADLCLESPSCRFFSVMVGGWCKLTAACEDIEDVEHSDIYKLPESKTTTATARAESRMVPRIGVAQPNAISIEIEASVGKGPSFEPLVANAISNCTMQAIEPSHISFSYASTKKISATVLISPPNWLKLESVFDLLEACGGMETEIVDGLEAGEESDVSVDLDPPQLVDAAARSKTPAALSTQGWCCLGSWLFDDPCSECTPSLTPRGVAVRDHSCAGSEEACLSCSENWAEPTWCPGRENLISI